MPARRRRIRDQRGLTLIEVVVAFFILFVVTLAVLAMFSAAAAVNSGSFARTDMQYAAEKVVEAIRMQYALSQIVVGGRKDQVNNLTCCPLTAATANPYTLPSGSGCDTFWGAWGFAKYPQTVYDTNARFTISYEVAARGTTVSGWREITITVQPKAGGYTGMAPARKVIRYVAQIPNWND
jgi:Tfp pilus assembly protein PilV